MTTEPSRNSLLIKDGRLRPTLRVVLYGVLLFFLVLLIAEIPILLALASGLVPTADLGSGSLSGIGGVLQNAGVLMAVVISTLLARRFFDKRSFVSLGFERTKGWTLDILVGLALGVGLIGLIFLVEWAAGFLTVESFGLSGAANPTGALISVFIVFVFVAITEELMSRGYILQNLADGWGIPIAVAVSSTVFAVLHGLNPNVTSLALFNLFLAGVFFAIGYLAVRNLWLPMAMHFAWNFAEGPLFGFPVSGLGTPSMTSIRQGGEDLITGGAFGPEGGLIVIPALAIGIVLLLLWSRIRPGRNQVKLT